MEPATMCSPSGNEASPGSHHQRGFKSLTPRGSTEKMGPRHGPIGKHHRQQRQTSKGPVKIYPADASNFKDLVYEHTSMRTSSSMLDVAAQPTSPLTPHSTSNSSAWGVMSQPTSPATPHSIQSSTPSPLTSPQSGYPKNGTNVNSLQLPSPVHAELSSLFNSQLSVPGTYSCHNAGLPFSYNTNLLDQSNSVHRCASRPCLGISSEAGNVPSDDGCPYGMRPKQFASQLSWERRNLSMSPRSYEKQLSLERFVFGG